MLCGVNIVRSFLLHEEGIGMVQKCSRWPICCINSTARLFSPKWKANFNECWLSRWYHDILIKVDKDESRQLLKTCVGERRWASTYTGNGWWIVRMVNERKNGRETMQEIMHHWMCRSERAFDVCHLLWFNSLLSWRRHSRSCRRVHPLLWILQITEERWMGYVMETALSFLCITVRLRICTSNV